MKNIKIDNEAWLRVCLMTLNDLLDELESTKWNDKAYRNESGLDLRDLVYLIEVSIQMVKEAQDEVLLGSFSKN